MNVTIRSSDIGELAERPELAQQAGTATVLAGTGSVLISISTLNEILAAPDARWQLKKLLNALREQELEQEFAYAMAILDTDDTGIENTLWFVPVPGGVHGPRIKVAIDPAKAVRQNGQMATVPFDAPAEGEISPELERQVRQFIALNRDALMRYWRLDPSITSTKKFVELLRPISPR